MCTYASLSRSSQVDKDHIPIGARLIVSTSTCNSNNDRRRIVKYDLAKVKCPENAKAFKAKLRDLPVVGIEVENTSHCHLIQNYLHDALVECFPMSKSVKKQPYISDHTFQCVKEGHVLCKDLF